MCGPLILCFLCVCPADIGDKTTCYAKREGDSPSKLGAGDATEVQYLVKWRNWSYLHNTWETGMGCSITQVSGDH